MTGLIPRTTVGGLASRLSLAAEDVASRRALVVAALLVTAWLVRLSHAGAAPLDFHAARQYRSLIIARHFFFESTPAIPAWQRDVAEASYSKQGILELPIMELVVASGYGLLGSEQLWLPVVLSSTFWVGGGMFLYFIVRRVVDHLGAVLAVAFYLFLPFAVAASRSFQPDPLMVALMLAGIWAMLRYADDPSQWRLVVAAATSSAAVLVQPRSLPVLVAVLLALALFTDRPRRAFSARRLLMLAGLSLPPLLAVYGYGLVAGAFWTQMAQAIAMPRLWIDPFFWRGWLINISATVGFPAFIGSILGLLTFRSRTARAIAFGSWGGYFVFGLVFTYAVAAHDYYHLQLVPIVALSVAPLLAALVRHVTDARPGAPWRALIWSILGVALVLALVEGRARISNADWEEAVAVKQEIGEAVAHSERTIILAADYGAPLEYHGILAGSAWPLAADLEWERLAGRSVANAEDRFATWFQPSAPEFFIIEDFAELEQQPDLKRFLDDEFTLAAGTDDYLIYDLRPPTR